MATTPKDPGSFGARMAAARKAKATGPPPSGRKADQPLKGPMNSKFLANHGVTKGG